MKKKLQLSILCNVLMLFIVLNVFSQETAVWNGSLSTSWADASNWTPTTIPDSTTDVIISIASNQPVITGNAAVNSVLMGANTALTVQSGSNLTITNAVTVDDTALFLVETGSNLIQVNNSENTGKISVRRNSSALMRQDYTLWSTPVAGQNLLAFSPQTLANRFYTYNTATNLYSSIAPSTNVLATGQGYLIRMPNNHPTTATIWSGLFTGVPNNGEYPLTLNNGGVNFSYNLVGNPYPSSIDMAAFVADNSAFITGTLYFWRETNGNSTNNAYCTWAGGTFTSNGEAQVGDPSGLIQTGQGFFVEAKPAQTSLVFKNTQRSSATGTAFFKNSLEERNTVWLNLTNSTGIFSQMAIGYISGATAGVDSFDGKYLADGTTSLTSVLDNTDFVIQGRALPFEPTDIVPLNFKTETPGEYTITIANTIGLFDGLQDVFIRDNFMSNIHNLSDAPYNFNSAAGLFNSRFEIIFQSVLSTVHQPDPGPRVFVFKRDHQIVVMAGNNLISKIKIYDISGRLIAEKDDIDGSESVLDLNNSEGVLIVKVILNTNETIIKKL